MKPAGPEAAFVQSLRLLERRDRSEARLRSELAERGFDDAAIEATVERLRSHRYLDDSRFADELADRLARRGHGSVRARRDLEQAGVAFDVIAAALARTFAHEQALAEKVIATRYRPPLTPITRAKAAHFLLGRGFPEELVESILATRDDG